MIDENSLILDGHIVIGADEVGRGALAGPIVTCACAINLDFINRWQNWDEKENTRVIIRDSKKMTHLQRERSAKYLKKSAVIFKTFQIEAEEIDSIGMQEANKSALRKALEPVLSKIATLQEKKKISVLVDHVSLEDILGHKVYSISKGESKSIAIAAASIIAKTHRDALMVKKAVEFPEYSWDKNKGYGTKRHLGAIRRVGLSSYHRRTFIHL